MPTIFISYATEDRVRAKSIYDALEATGWDCWMASEDIPAGAEWAEFIVDAIEKSKVFILILSASAIASREVRRELELAREHDLPIVPFALEETELGRAFKYHLSTIQQLRADQLSAQAALELLRTHVSQYVPPPPRPIATAAPMLLPLPQEVWEELLWNIREGRVVTVIGPELLEVTIAGRHTQLYLYLAERVAECLQIPAYDLPATGALAEVSGRWIDARGEMLTLFHTIQEVFRPVDQIEIPASLRQLAKIQQLNLFITTSFDPFMERALNQERFAGGQGTTVLSHSREMSNDLYPDADRQQPVVFHLFGRLSALPNYAVMEDDMTESLRSFGSPDTRPTGLLHELDTRMILYVGASLPDALARSFLRVIHGRRAAGYSRQQIIIADSKLRDSADFQTYARRSGMRLSIYPDSAITFVDELSQRWSELPPATSSPPEIAERPGLILVSSAPADRDEASRLMELLREAKLEAWVDSFDMEIPREQLRAAIRDCSVYIAVISRNTLNSPRLAHQWAYAVEAAAERRSAAEFIVPIVVDDTPRDHRSIPQKLRELEWLRLSEDGPEIARRVVSLYRDFQRRAAS